MAPQETYSDLGDSHGPARRWQERQQTGHQASGKGRPAAPATPQDATGINPEKRKPIHPGSVYLPPP